MAIQSGAEPYSKPWVNWVAGRIQDPVTRLRFLQAAAPPPELVNGGRRSLLLLAPALRAFILAAFCLVQGGGHLRPAPKPPLPAALPHPATGPPAASIWLVEKTDSSEIYSNGLRIDNRFQVSNRPRSYLAFPMNRGTGIRRTEAAGIVFHATQSPQAPFQADQNRVLKKIGESLLEYVRRKRAYHFLIDRFGRVYRVVAETDAANHAGYSVWSDPQWLYVNLNESYLGIAIEALSRPGHEELEMSPAQVRSAAMLVEMLRSRYRIPAANCVTHAQVSVNPANMEVGYHTDWASGFPFAEVGLPDNYASPPPALWAFGFEFSADYLQWSGHTLAFALQTAESEIAAAAEQAGMSLRTYRKSLQNQYRLRLDAVRRGSGTDSE